MRPGTKENLRYGRDPLAGLSLANLLMRKRERIL
jgi:hypothetical protein